MNVPTANETQKNETRKLVVAAAIACVVLLSTVVIFWRRDQEHEQEQQRAVAVAKELELESEQQQERERIAANERAQQQAPSPLRRIDHLRPETSVNWSHVFATADGTKQKKPLDC